MLSYMWGTFFAVLVGASLCAAEGVPLATYRGFTGALASTLGEWAVDLLERVETRRFGGETSASDISTHHDAFAHLTELAGTHGIDPAIHAVERVFQAALEAGRGGEDFAALYDFLRAKAG